VKKGKTALSAMKGGIELISCQLTQEGRTNQGFRGREIRKRGGKGTLGGRIVAKR